MTQEIKVLADNQNQLYNLHRVSNDIKEKFDVWESSDHYDPLLIFHPSDPNQADSIINYLEENYPDYVLLWE